MPDNVGYTPGAGAIVAADEISGVLYQRIKPVVGIDGVAVDVSNDNPMPLVANQTDDLLRMLSRIVKLLESNAVVDVAQRQRVNIDAITGMPLGNQAASSAITVTLSTNGTGVLSTVSSVTNMVSNAGMDREQYINIAKNTYANSLRSKLEFV